MTRLFDENGVVTASTLVEAGPCFVTQLRTAEADGYVAVQLGFGAKPRPSRPQKGQLKKAGLPDRQGLETIREVPADSVEDLELGARIDASMFSQGEIVDVIGTSKGKGFAGVMKRHNFKGQGASHGNHKHHRAPGSVGACATPSRVFKGTRMAGRMGGERVTTLNLVVVEAGQVQGEGSASSWKQIISLLRDAIAHRAHADGGARAAAGGERRTAEIDPALAANAIRPGHPTLYPAGPPPHADHPCPCIRACGAGSACPRRRRA